MADFQFYLNTQGLRGRTGAKGADGFAPIIAIGQNTINTFTLLITTVDGTFETPNLRGSIINNAGAGTFLRYDAESDSIYLSELPTASETEVGGVTIATDEELANAAGTGVVTADSMGVGIYGALKAGNNVSLSLDNETGLVTINTVDTKYTLPVATSDTLGGVKPDGTTITVTEDGVISAKGGGGSGGTSDYSKLSNKPQINGIELNGDSSLDLLDIQGKITTEKPLNIAVKETGLLKGLTRLSDGTYQMPKDGYVYPTGNQSKRGTINNLNQDISPLSDGYYVLSDDAFPNYIDIPVTDNSIVSIPANIPINRLMLGFKNDYGTFIPTVMINTYHNASQRIYAVVSQARRDYRLIKGGTNGFSIVKDISTYDKLKDWNIVASGANTPYTRKYLQYSSSANIFRALSNETLDSQGDIYSRSYKPYEATNDNTFVNQAKLTSICRIIGFGGNTIDISDIKLFDGTGIDILNAPEEELSALPNLYNPEKSIITRTLSLDVDGQTVVVDSNKKLSVGDDVMLKEQLFSQLVQGNNISITEDASTHKVTISSTGSTIDAYTKDETRELLAGKADISALDNKQDTLVSGTNIKTINGESVLGEGNIVISGSGETVDAYTKTETNDLLAAKQDTLVSGTNIKTVNGNSLLGEGDLVISGGGGESGASIDDSTTSTASTWSSSKINTELTSRDTTITEAQNEITLIQGDVAALDADVSTLKTTTEEHTTSISSLNTLITQLTDRIAALEAEINGGNA